MKKYFPILINSPLFKNIKESELSGMLECLQAVEKSYCKNSDIFIAGQRALYVGIICAGRVQVVKDDVMGNRSIQANLSTGDIFGETFACAGIDILPVSVVAREDTDVLLLDYRRIMDSCGSACGFHNRMIENMLRIMAEKNLFLNRKLDIASARSTREKIMKYLLYYAGEKGSLVFDIPLNRQELADYLSVDRSAMSAELGRMRDEGLIEFDKSRFELLGKT